MGQKTQQNLALDTKIWKAVFKKIEARGMAAADAGEGSGWIIVGACFVFALVLSLWGPEAFMFEIGLSMAQEELNNGLVWLPVMGKLKGDSREETCFLRSVTVTQSGISVTRWHKMLLCIHRRAGRKVGPAICNKEGCLLTSKEVNQKLWEVLEELYEEGGLEFPKAIQQKEDIEKLVSLNRSPRRSSESCATKMSASEADKIIVNRWTKKLSAKGSTPNEAMSIS